LVQASDSTVQSLIRDLPDERAAVAFLDRLQQEQPRNYQTLLRERGLLSDTLALVSWSPLLGTTLEQNPSYISWLQRERLNARVRSREELKESLARFALTNSSLSPAVMLARFRRRELLRTYLHDVRGTHTLVETTEELSNVADAVLDYALNLARQDLDNKYGLPRLTDDRGRIATADFTIVALGKLGSYELNYASDIDLMFIYSDEGTTSGIGERGEVTNREYFAKLAESVAKLVGQPAGEGAAYRVDLRLRPHGRDGALACSLTEAVRYYREKAQSWELQALIRARSAAGSGSLYQRFSNALRESVFRTDISVSAALASVRLAKQKIDRHRERESGFNVKLHRGGIREIEFIAQALQLAHAGPDEWLRAPHTLISLGRLADRNLISEQERTYLSDAYVFLRTLEHRLQMEQGLQTHTVPQRAEARVLVARRMSFSGDLGLEDFDKTLAMHAENVRRAFDRVFQENQSIEDSVSSTERQSFISAPVFDPHSVAARTAASLLLPHILPLEHADHGWTVETLTQRLRDDAARSVNPHRALTLLARIAASVDKANQHVQISEDSLSHLVLLCGASEFFGEILASNPVLINSMGHYGTTSLRRDLKATLKANLDSQSSFSAELSTLRQQWSRVLLEIVLRDGTGEISVTESNRLQTDLAVASLNVSYLSARREMIRRYDRPVSAQRIAILGLGRLGTGGVDYGSDLDLIIVYDSLVPSPVASLTREEAYARLAELMTSALSSVTREGFLYRVDLRLRPNGQSGPLVVSSEAFLEYAKEKSAIWEWLAYVKLRAVAGDLELGKMIETHARHAIHELARQTSPAELKRETRRVRDRLELEKGKRARQGELDIKYAAGGMLDVYFATRYLQLMDDVPDEGEDRSTRFTLERLEANGSLTTEDYSSLEEGYALLRSVDHQLRLVLGKSTRLPAAAHPVTRDVARKVGFNSASELFDSLNERMKAIRVAYDNITTN
jgi:[glutamine synthetase] adenylyltransferase / [glutamine synthetase]-adenylyl-L-tyrosine phosphorylase